VNVFKLHPGKNESFTLWTPAVFHGATSKRYPWYQEREGKVRHYAVCPECDNPIQIINLDVDSKVDGAGNNLPLYAKHTAASIQDVADYDKLAYEECSLANPSSFNGTNKRPAGSKVVASILEVLIEHADAVHFIVQRFLDASVPAPAFQSLLRQFSVHEGYLYRAVTTSNLPFALLYMAGNQDLFPYRPDKDSLIAAAVKKSQNFEMNGERIVRTAKGGGLRFFVTDHKIESTSEGARQYMTLVVEEEIAGKKNRLLSTKQELEVAYFRNMVDKRQRLRDIADEQFGGLLKSRAR
jgi:hypothetical protein